MIVSMSVRSLFSLKVPPATLSNRSFGTMPGMQAQSHARAFRNIGAANDSRQERTDAEKLIGWIKDNRAECKALLRLRTGR